MLLCQSVNVCLPLVRDSSFFSFLLNLTNILDQQFNPPQFLQSVWVLVIDSNLAKVNQIKYWRLFAAFTIIYHGQSIIVFLLFKQFVLNKYFAENVDYLAVLLLFSLTWLMSLLFCTIFQHWLPVKTSNSQTKLQKFAKLASIWIEIFMTFWNFKLLTVNYSEPTSRKLFKTNICLKLLIFKVWNRIKNIQQTTSSSDYAVEL